jgi:predicted nucleic acid-binding protein
MNAIDTNIWIYTHDTRDLRKQEVAQQLVATARPFILLWQVGCEFIAASRKLAVIGFTEDQAWSALTKMQNMAGQIALPDLQVWTDAQDLQKRHVLAFWDALLVAACKRAGVLTLHTEDMGAPRGIDGVSLVNPFLPTP